MLSTNLLGIQGPCVFIKIQFLSFGKLSLVGVPLFESFPISCRVVAVVLMFTVWEI